MYSKWKDPKAGNAGQKNTDVLRFFPAFFVRNPAGNRNNPLPGINTPESVLIVADFSAPLGPPQPAISYLSRKNEISSTALFI
jgi:hypothetical protein